VFAKVVTQLQLICYILSSHNSVSTQHTSSPQCAGTAGMPLLSVGPPIIFTSLHRFCALQCTQSTTALRAVRRCLLRVLPATSTRPTAVCNGGRCVRGLRQAGLGGKDGSLISALAAASHTTPADLLLQQWECIIVSGRLRDQKNVSGHFEPPSLTLPLSNNLADTCLQV